MNLQAYLPAIAIGAGLLFLLTMFFVIGVVVLFQAFIFRDTARIPEVITRLFKLEHQIQMMSSTQQMNHMEESVNDMLKDQAERNLNSMPSLPPGYALPPGMNGKILYKSIDGKHAAASLEELFEKMSQDPESGIKASDLDALKSLFEQITKDIEPIDSDDDDEKEDWQR